MSVPGTDSGEGVLNGIIFKSPNLGRPKLTSTVRERRSVR